MHIEKIVYPHLGIIDEVWVADDDEIEIEDSATDTEESQPH
jgi:hypothetical protein